MADTSGEFYDQLIGAVPAKYIDMQDGTFAVAGISAPYIPYISAFDWDAASPPNVIYIGLAVPGTAKSDAKWQIRKMTYSGSNMDQTLYANGNRLFNNVWNNRAALAYS
jgi:hypothetical protein